MIHQETQAQQGKLLQGRAALWYVYRQYGLSAAATHAIDLQTLMNLKFTGDLEGFLQAWDTCILGISFVPSPDLLHSLFDLLSNAEQLDFIYRSACRVVENMKAERTRQERMRVALAAQNPALAALNQKAADAAAAAAAAAANPPPRRPRTRSPRKAAAAALAAVPPVQRPLQPLGVCRAVSQDGTYKFGDRYVYNRFASAWMQTGKRSRSRKPQRSPKRKPRRARGHPRLGKVPVVPPQGRLKRESRYHAIVLAPHTDV